MYSHVIIFTILINLALSRSFDPDEDRNTSELIRSKGYPCEEHDVVTDDGYILTIQRIPYGVRRRLKSDRRPVAFLQHGLLDASSTWVINLANESLGYILADYGYDVWLGNMRGNTYGLRHKSLDPNSNEFWDFSWDDMAKHDLPSMLYYVLNVTGEETLYYIGHSQGTIIGFAQFDLNQDLASRIKLFIALGPVATVGQIESPIRYLAGPSPAADDIWYALFGKRDFLPSTKLIRWLAEKVCDLKFPQTIFCANVIFILCGPSKFLNETRLPVYITHAPAGTSVKNLLHFAQMVYSKKFQMFDYGSKMNILYYNQTTPPLYDVKNIKMPVGLIWAQNDWLADPDDVQYLRNNLPNIVYDKYIPNWDHLDFIWAWDAANLIYYDIVKLLKSYDFS